MNQTQSPTKPLLAAAWLTILLATLPKIILQELFQYKVSADLQAVIALLVALTGFGLTFAWQALRPLRSLLRRALRNHQGLDGRIFGLAVGQIDARNTRPVLGLVHPLLAGCLDFFVYGNWLHYARRVKEKRPAHHRSRFFIISSTYFTKFRSTVCKMPPLR